jgi:hypothetical protein
VKYLRKRPLAVVGGEDGLSENDHSKKGITRTLATEALTRWRGNRLLFRSSLPSSTEADRLASCSCAEFPPTFPNDAFIRAASDWHRQIGSLASGNSWWDVDTKKRSSSTRVWARTKQDELRVLASDIAFHLHETISSSV